jgi:dihydrofolate reductase
MISLIAAIQKKDRGIGLGNELLFRISDDLKRFKALTSGHPIIMGRKTFDSIGSKPLPNRTNIVVTRQELSQEGVVFVHSLEEALEKAKSIDENIFVIGGAEIYKQTLPFADRIELTIVNSDVPADTFFPEYSEFVKEIQKENRSDEKSGLLYEWVSIERE